MDKRIIALAKEVLSEIKREISEGEGEVDAVEFQGIYLLFHPDINWMLKGASLVAACLMLATLDHDLSKRPIVLKTLAALCCESTSEL